MDVFLLGAGRPAHGQKPSALKNIALNTRAMDWQIHSFESVADTQHIHYLGGYHVDAVIEKYPQLNFTVIPDWEENSLLHSFLKAPFSNRPAFVAYSDTVFRNEVIKNMLSIDADIVYGVDSQWKQRYKFRTSEDIQTAETITMIDPAGKLSEVEFTGLVYFKPSAIRTLLMQKETSLGSNLIELIKYLEQYELTVKSFDVEGNWAEFNSPDDIAHFILGSKAETLARLEPLVRNCHIGKQVSFTSARWDCDSNNVLNEISECFGDADLVVRSSSKSEDNWHSSNAGGFESILNVDGAKKEKISGAIESVIVSYGSDRSSDDQILVQEFLQNVSASGVVFTCGLETGSPYYRFNFDDKTASTDTVTSGNSGDLRTIVLSRFVTEYLELVEPELVPVLDAVQELEQLLGFHKLDIEFALDNSGLVHIFQVRPIAVDHSEYEVDSSALENNLKDCASRYEAQQNPSPFVYGSKSIFANMPDWNPAEIIGTRPKPLAFSVYRQLITNEIWAQQRTEFGYRDVRPNPLISSFAGQPYVDARASLNSFIPAALNDDAAKRLAEAYLNILSDHPQYHDKIEFNVAFTIWTPNFIEEASTRLIPYGVKPNDISQLDVALKHITCKALNRLQNDIHSINVLNQRRVAIDTSNIPVVDKIFALLDDCKRYGTLAFSHAARSGFVAVTLLNSFVAKGMLAEERRLQYLNSLNTVAGNLSKDKQAHAKQQLSLQELIEKYGHLRPGTYEITEQAYWEDPERYLVLDALDQNEQVRNFEFSPSEISEIAKVLSELGSKLSAQELCEYLAEAIQAREFIKFEFTKNLSYGLDMIVKLGNEICLSREDLSYLEYNDLEQLKLNAVSNTQLYERINRRKRDHIVTCLIELPSVIQKKADFYCFERFVSQPNFVTIGKVEAVVKRLVSNDQNELDSKIVLIPQADPGYDWLFGQGIKGLITQYGGANSHMAIRAAEMGLPAAIGVGEKLYEQIACMKRIVLDCANHKIMKLE